MPKFCGNCGTELRDDGSCPNCGAKPNGGLGINNMPFASPAPNQNLGQNTVFAGGEQNTMFAGEQQPSGGEQNTVFAGSMDAKRSGTVYAGNGSSESGAQQSGGFLSGDLPPVTYETSDGKKFDAPEYSPPAAQVGIPNDDRVTQSPSGRKKNSTAKLVAKILCWVLSLGAVGTIGVLSYKKVINIPGVSGVVDNVVQTSVYGEYKDDFIVTGDKITNAKITDDDSAIKAASEFAKDRGFESIADEFTVVSSETIGDITYYRLQENFKGYPVYGRMLTLAADKDGSSCGLSSNIIDIPDTLKLEIPDFSKDRVLDALQSLNDSGVEINVGAYTEAVYTLDYCDKPMLVYEVMAVVNNMNFSIFIDPQEEKVINGFCLDSNAELRGDGLNMPDNPQTFNGSSYGNKVAMIDEERNIYVYNAQEGSSTIVVEYYDQKEKKSYYNRRFNIGKVDDLPGEDVCVIYDDDGNYYEYDYDKGYFADGDVHVKPEDLLFEGYTVFNRASGKSVDVVTADGTFVSDPLAVRLMVKTANAYDFFADALGRKGYDGKSGRMMAVCNDHLSGDSTNAFSAGDNAGFSMITFGSDNPMEFDDVAHEMAHSVEQSICSLHYQNESGAVMEGIADVFGELVEDYYNDAPKGTASVDTLNNTCDWIASDRMIRSPLLSNMPDKYKGTGFKKKISSKDWDKSNMGMTNDFGNVHNNSTVISHTAFLMVNSGADDEKLSTENLMDLWYRTLCLLPSNCTFGVFRDCMEVQADKMLDAEELTQQQRAHVSRCFDETNIPASAYSNKIDLKITADDWDNKFTVKVEGERFKAVGKSYKEEFELDKGDEDEDGRFVFSQALELDDGSYTIRVTDDANKMNFIERDVIVKTYSDDEPEHGTERKEAYFVFKDPQASAGADQIPQGTDAQNAQNVGEAPSDVQNINTDLPQAENQQ